MADTVSYTLTGIDELLAKLESVSYDVKRKGGRAALRKAAMVVVMEAQANAMRIDDPKTAREISKNITLRWATKRYRASGDLGFRVGVLGGAVNQHIARNVGEFKGKGKDNPGGDTWYWRLVEFGTEKMRAQPFMRPALENHTDKATNVFLTEYSKSIDRAIKRAAKGSSKRGMRTTRGH